MSFQLAWHKDGLCHNGEHPSDIDFFSTDYAPGKPGERAIAYCQGTYYDDGSPCPVIDLCLDATVQLRLGRGADFGIVGGTTPNQRRAIRPARDNNIPHGILSTYTNHRCRCDDCRLAAKTDSRQRRANKTKEQNAAHRRQRTSNSPHGTNNRYTNGRCRCEPCKQAAAEYTRNYKRKKANA